ncbi:MAG: polyprenyl diphosphate synthase, partial [Gemmatimonadota bacterium]
LSDAASRAVEELQDHTRGGEDLQLNLAISYGSRTEIVEAARRLAELASLGAVRPEEITEERFEEELYTAGWPDPDLLVRTSGERRLSNFLLWQIAYAELHVSEVMWPEFGRAGFYEAILDFQSRERRFGKVEA